MEKDHHGYRKIQMPLIWPINYMNRAKEIIQSTKLQAILTKNTERHDKYFKNTNFHFFFYGSQMAKIDRTNTSQIHKFTLISYQNYTTQLTVNLEIGKCQPIRLAGSYRCWFVKKYCWLVCVKEKYCSN